MGKAYSDKEKAEILNTIFQKVSEGESLRSVLRTEGMIGMTTFDRWLSEDEKTRLQYARAREQRADKIFEEILEIADEANNDTMIIGDKEVTNHENINRSRLRVDARKWMLGKMQPKKYGDKLDVTTDGEKIQASQIIHIKNNDQDISLG